MSKKEKIKEIVDYMISEGTENTSYNNWIFDIPELCEHFDLTADWFNKNNDAILDELDARDEVLDVEQNFDYNQKPTNYDIQFDTASCGMED